MTEFAVETLDESSAVQHYIAEGRRREARHLVRAVIRKAWCVDITHSQATAILNAAGIGVLEEEVEWMTEWLDILENPKGYAEAEADDQGFTGNLDEAQDRFQSVAQHDLDTLIERLVRDASGTSVEIAVLAVVNVLVAS